MAGNHLSHGPDEIWRLGEVDGSSIEFAATPQSELRFRIGADGNSMAFPGMHKGSVDVLTGEEQPSTYVLEFGLQTIPESGAALSLSLIYREAAPDSILIGVNGRRGTFPVMIAPKKADGWREANSPMLAKQDLRVSIPAAWLNVGDNSISVTPLGVGAMEYDAIGLAALDGADLTQQYPHLVPTIFYRDTADGLLEKALLQVPFMGAFKGGEARIRLAGVTYRQALQSDYDFGILSVPVHVAALDAPSTAEVQISLDGRATSHTHLFRPAKRWKLYVAPGWHNDPGFTDLQPHVHELDNRNTDTVLDILDRNPAYKFNMETSWLVDNFLDNRTKPSRDKLIAYAKQGRLGIDAMYLNLLTGLTSGEALHRSLYFAHNLHRQMGTKFNAASVTDIPSHSWFLPTLLTDAGINYFAIGGNQARGPMLSHGPLNDHSPFYWEGMNGERLLTFYARSYYHVRRLRGRPEWSQVIQAQLLRRNIPQYLMRYNRPDYAPDAVLVYGAYLDNPRVPKLGDVPLFEAFNAEYAYPKVIFATNADYFDYIAQNYADQLAVFRGDGGAYWDDGAATSARQTRLNQHSKQRLPLAESIASMASLFYPAQRYQAEDFATAWRHVLFYDEHTWGAHNSISQPDRESVRRQWEIKADYAHSADLLSRNLLTRSLDRLVQNIDNDGDAYFIFNMQNRARPAVLELELDADQRLIDPATNTAPPHEILSVSERYYRLRLLAEDVPSMGYRGYHIRQVDEKIQADTKPDVHEPAPISIENEYYKLTINPKTGGLASIYDKAARRELVDQTAAQALNEYVYVSGGENSSVLDAKRREPAPDLTVHAPKLHRVITHQESAVGARLVVEMSAKNTPSIRSEYRLYKGIKRLDITNTITKDEVVAKEAVYFAFPYQGKGRPTKGLLAEYQNQNGWVQPGVDQLPGAAHEWYTTQNLVHICNDDFSFVLASPDVPLFTFTDINRGRWSGKPLAPNGTIFSYVMQNYWWTNFKASQGGTFTFAYAITSGKNLSRQQLAAFDADTRTLAVGFALHGSSTAPITPREDRPFALEGGRFFSIDDPNLQVVGLKAAEDGQGYVLRLRSVSGESGVAVLQSLALDVAAAYLANGVEVAQSKLHQSGNSIQVPYGPYSYITLRLEFGS